MLAIVNICLRDLLACLRFFTRLPLPALPFETNIYVMLDFKIAVRMLPFAGMMIGLIGGLMLIFGHILHLPPILGATLMFSAMALITGGLHEDGLADVADGFGGGQTIARKLEIMKDSRLGSYGVLALIFSTLMKVTAVSALMTQAGPYAAAGACVAAAAVSRGLCLMPLCLLPAARADGAAAAAARPTQSTQIVLALSSIGLAIVFAGWGVFGVNGALFAFICASVVSFALTRLSKAQIGGQTGDVAGATQQVAEITFLIALLVA